MSNSFEIHNSDNQAIPLEELNKEAAKFWGKELDPNFYANPTQPFSNPDNLVGKELVKAQMIHSIRTSPNWFDAIGWYIANQKSYYRGWTNIAASMMVELIGMRFINSSPGYNEKPVKIAEVIYLNSDPYPSLSLDITIQIASTLKYFKPYIDLINHWQSKGYKPVQIKE